jgi:IS30 family transposase
MLVKVQGKDTDAVVQALSRHVRQLPATLRRSLNWDRGLEMARHKEFTVAKVNVYFCDPQSLWQRGNDENTNLLLRQYCPEEPTLPLSRKRSSTRSRSLEINVPEKPWVSKLLRLDLHASVASTV